MPKINSPVFIEPCVRCRVDFATINRLCDNCNSIVDAQIDSNIKLAIVIADAMQK